ncbi:Uncharacterized protein TCM_027423 [Theobroma cacao]|uniref:Uncharacterized protein n=1 Tax=Theobroma cacao TaxID=3641 RepID=A0A061G829_THECC|nr:Uncharacterized protein TCM_027423 [Theobroma cacao]
MRGIFVLSPSMKIKAVTDRLFDRFGGGRSPPRGSTLSVDEANRHDRRLLLQSSVVADGGCRLLDCNRPLRTPNK